MTEQIALIETVRPLPRWMPPYLRRLLAGKKVAFDIPAQVRARCRRPAKSKVSEWAVANRQVMEGAHTGPWRHEFAPHTVKIMDTFGEPWVREVWFCKVEQSGGTNSMLNCLGWGSDCDPGDFFMLMPTEKDSDKMAARIKLLFRHSRRLKDLVSDRADDMTNLRISLINGVIGLMAHANSPSSMASHPAKYAFGDEVDKYPAMAGRETDPITLIRKRGRTFKGKVKRMFTSTCAGKFVYSETMKCHQVWRFDVRCPHCGAMIHMDTEHLLIPEDATPETADMMTIAYECNDCGQHWDEEDRYQAIRNGRWVCIKGNDIRRPGRVGFHHRAWECLDIPLHEIAAAWLRAKSGNIAAKIAWANGYEARDYKDDLGDRVEAAIYALCDERPAGEVHPLSDVLTIHIDTQDKGFWYTIRGWQYDGHLSSWLVKAGYVPSLRSDDFSALDKIIFDDEYFDASGKKYEISYGIIDSAGHRTAEVYTWCKRTGIFAARGAQGRKVQPVTVSKLEHYPGSNRPIPGGLLLYTLDTHYHKDILSGKLQIDPTDPGAFVLHSGFSALQHALKKQHPDIPIKNGLTDYAAHMCAERRTEKHLWENPKRQPEHLWDCEQMGIALAYYLGFHECRKDAAAAPPPKQSTGTTTRPSWFNRR